jgi:hypothetical protein
MKRTYIEATAALNVYCREDGEGGLVDSRPETVRSFLPMEVEVVTLTGPEDLAAIFSGVVGCTGNGVKVEFVEGRFLVAQNEEVAKFFQRLYDNRPRFLKKVYRVLQSMAQDEDTKPLLFPYNQGENHGNK